MPVQCRIGPASELPDQHTVDRLRRLATSLISDVFGRWAGAPGILPITGLGQGVTIAGAALTVRTRPGDNLVVHKALEIARPGEILVVDAGGATDRAILGGLIGRYATSKGIVGIVVDGAVRDRSELSAAAPPVFARGLSHLGPYKDGPGDIRVAIVVGGLVIHDGDLVVCDEDGVAVVPRDRAEEIISAAEQKREAEEAESAAIALGNWNRQWIDESLTVIDIKPVRTQNERN